MCTAGLKEELESNKKHYREKQEELSENNRQYQKLLVCMITCHVNTNIVRFTFYRN